MLPSCVARQHQPHTAHPCTCPLKHHRIWKPALCVHEGMSFLPTEIPSWQFERTWVPVHWFCKIWATSSAACCLSGEEGWGSYALTVTQWPTTPLCSSGALVLSTSSTTPLPFLDSALLGMCKHTYTHTHKHTHTHTHTHFMWALDYMYSSPFMHVCTHVRTLLCSGASCLQDQVWSVTTTLEPRGCWKVCWSSQGS